MSLTPGARLGSYDIVGPLGAGGMGEVYLAKDTRLGREVAIKVLPADVAGDPDRLARFEREARAVSALNHPHIVTLHEVGTSAFGPYLVLERIDGRSIRELLNDGPVPVRRLLTIGAQIAEGLAKAHAAGIVHRDLKPGNVMVTTDGFAKILDFGLAKLVHPELDANAMEAATTIARDTASGLVMGTVGYLSPEQAAGRPVDYRADQFALGALLYEMATRERPFKRATPVESLAATIADDPAPVRSKRPDVPAPLEWLIDRCLSKEPGERYASTADLARELGSLRDHLSDLTRMPSGDMAASPRVTRRRWLSRTGVALLAAATAIGGYVAAQLTTETVMPSYQPLTFQRGTVTGARFGPDGKTIYYSAAYGDGPSRVYQTHVDRTESKLLDIPPGFLLGVSAKQELAVLLTNDRAIYNTPGRLVRVPAMGGTPRPLAEDVQYGDWGPDGEQLAVGRGGSCEFPIGRIVASPCGTIRVSPVGDRLAVTRGGGVEVLDLAGKRVTGSDMRSVFGSTWAPDGQEVWFTGSESGGGHDRALYALDLRGRRRLIARVAGAMTVYDVAPDRRSALVATGAGWNAVNAARVGGGQDQSLDVLGRSALTGLSTDGKWVLIDETREVGTGAYRRSTDGNDQIPYVGDAAQGLSPDGAWVLVHPIGNLRRLKLISAATGDSRDVPLPPGLELFPEQMSSWSGDGRRVFTWFRPEQAPPGPISRLHMREGDGSWLAVTPPTPTGPIAVSPDGGEVAVRGQDRVVTIFSTGGLPPRRLEGEHGRPIHWSGDNQEIYFLGPENFPARVYRRNVVTGRVTPWRTIRPPDATGVMHVNRVLIAPGEQFYVYQYGRGLNDLYLARDLSVRSSR